MRHFLKLQITFFVLRGHFLKLWLYCYLAGFLLYYIDSFALALRLRSYCPDFKNLRIYLHLICFGQPRKPECCLQSLLSSASISRKMHLCCSTHPGGISCPLSTHPWTQHNEFGVFGGVWASMREAEMYAVTRLPRSRHVFQSHCLPLAQARFIRRLAVCAPLASSGKMEH